MSVNLHSLVLLNDGTVKSFGYNTTGQLGLGNITNLDTPTLIPNLTNVKQTSCGYDYSLVLLNDGTLYSFGNNTDGQLGLGNTTTPISTPTLIPGLTNVKQIVGCNNHSLAVLNDGTVKGWGYNAQGELGLGNTTTPYKTPTIIPNLTNVKQIAGGIYHSLALLNDGTVKSFGLNDSGQLGYVGNSLMPKLIPSLSNVKQIAGGSYNSFALLNDGTIKAFGYNSLGELGLGNTTNPISTPTLIPGISNAKQISGGTHHTSILITDGTVYTFGYNVGGQLGLGDAVNRTSPTLIPNLTNVKQIASGYYYSMVLLDDGTVKAYGNNPQLGLGDITTCTTPTLIPNLSNISLLWDNILEIIPRTKFTMFLTDTKSAYGEK